MRRKGSSKKSAIPSENCRLLNVGIVVRGISCLATMKNLKAIRPSGLRLVAIANIEKSASWYKYADGLGIEVFESYRDLMSVEHLDLILELTGDGNILSDIIMHKPPRVGVLDCQASMQMIDMAQVYSQGDRSQSGGTLAVTLLEASPDGVLVIDRDYRILNCNKSPMIAGSAEKNAIIGKHCFEIIQSTSKPCQGVGRGCPATESLKTGRSARAIHETTGPNNVPQFRQVTAYPIFNRLGEVTQLALTIRDMTQVLSDKIEERTQAIKKDLARLVQEDRLASLGRLVASVCHEINNPITSIVTFTKVVQSRLESLTEKGELSIDEINSINRYLRLSFQEGMRCGDIVKKFLTFARPKIAEAKVIKIDELVGNIMLLAGHQLELANISYVVDLPPSPFTAWGDYAQLQQSLLNLIFNAMDAIGGGGTITISGGAEEEGDLVWLAVTDTGHGIKPEDLPRIFEPFFTTKTDGKGHGLGLSMVYGIIHEHHGVVEVESEPGKGTTFKIKLPRNEVTPRECGVVSSKAFTASLPDRE